MCNKGWEGDENVFQDRGTLNMISSGELRNLQSRDNAIGPVIQLVQQKSLLSNKDRLQQSPGVRRLLREWPKLMIENGILYRRTTDVNQMVLPHVLKPLIYRELHCEMCHLGANRVYQLARERVYWPGMEKDIDHFVKKVCYCIKRKAPHILPKAPLGTITSTRPMQIVGIDFMHLDTCSGGYQYILVVTDHFSRYTQAYPTRNKAAKTAAEKVYNDFVLRFGMPEKILHDQGGEFENSLFKQLNSLCGVKRLRTTPYHPQTNGQVERMNSTICGMLKTLSDREKTNWKQHLNKITFAYNCTINDTTGFSPYFLLFGRKPRLPIDTILGDPGDHSSTVPHKEYLYKWQEQMKQAYELAATRSMNRKLKDKSRRDRAACLTSLSIGDRVLVQNRSERGGTGKLRSYWEDEIAIVINCKGEDGLVYEIRPEHQPKAKSRILHRNMLLPVDCILEEPEGLYLKDKNSMKPPTKLEGEGGGRQGLRNQATDEQKDSSSEDEDIGFTPNQLNDLLNDGEDRVDDSDVDFHLQEGNEHNDRRDNGSDRRDDVRGDPSDKCERKERREDKNRRTGRHDDGSDRRKDVRSDPSDRCERKERREDENRRKTYNMRRRQVEKDQQTRCEHQGRSQQTRCEHQERSQQTRCEHQGRSQQRRGPQRRRQQKDDGQPRITFYPQPEQYIKPYDQSTPEVNQLRATQCAYYSSLNPHWWIHQYPELYCKL